MSRDAHESIYHELYHELRQMQPGAAIPSVRRLMARFRVSQVVIDRVMSRLREEFPIESQVGRGSFMGGTVSGEAGARRLLVRIYLPNILSSFQQDMQAAVCEEATRRGYTPKVTLYPWDAPPRRLEVTADTAAILLRPPSMLSAADLRAFEGVSVPLVLLDLAPLGLRLHGVASDNAYGGALAAEHLLSQGRRRLAILASEPSVSPNVGGRIRGFQRRCRLAGLPQPPVIGGDSVPGVAVADAAYSRMGDFLGRGQLTYDGLFCDSAATAMGALQACRDAAITVPDDLAIVAFDDSPEARYSHPRITVLRQDLERWAVVAFDIVAAGVLGPIDPRQIQVPPELIVRESSLSTPQSVATA